MALDGAHLTHGHPSAVQSPEVLASAVRDLMDETPLDEAARSARSLVSESRSPAEDVLAALEAALEDGGSPSGASPAARSLSSALAASLAAERGASHGVDGRPVPADFRAAVVRAASSGPDAAAMAGALLGALWGAAAVPPEWTSRLEGADVAEKLAATLAKASGAES
ncbi:MAG: hypothetical protein HOQ07_04865, partial [Sinomonas sp.]|nr:hypothetical protein [Sinomonas sp.]